MVRQCQALKGINAIRFESLHHRRESKNKSPSVGILCQNSYKQYDKYGLTKSQMKLILKRKSFTKQNIGIVPYSPQSVYYSICTIMSYVSHGNDANVAVKIPQMKLAMAYADKDIKQGEQLFIDYSSYVQDKEMIKKISEVKRDKPQSKRSKENQPIED